MLHLHCSWDNAHWNFLSFPFVLNKLYGLLICKRVAIKGRKYMLQSMAYIYCK